MKRSDTAASAITPAITLVTGGARSGKSAFALELAKQYDTRLFIATAQAMDPEFEARIRRHREERQERFSTIEEPLDLAGAIRSLPKGPAVAVVDCMTVWLGNLMHHQGADREDAPAITAFFEAIDAPPCDLVLVTNEVGLGLVPPDPVSRLFRDLAGFLNRKTAMRADAAYLVSCGIPLRLK